MSINASESVYETLQCELDERSYPIYVGELGVAGVAENKVMQANEPGLAVISQQLTKFVGGKQVAVITNETVAPLYLQSLLEALEDYQVDVYKLPDGEEYKTLESYNQVMDFLLKARHNRSTCLIALGGGVIGDLCGFVAATFQRGVDFIQIPTTLLAQVDSSVGGKTAVNHPEGKNMIGAFYQPKAVLADTSVLATLPPREFAAGLAEVIKYGVIDGDDFFTWLEEHIEDLVRRDTAALRYVIIRSCAVKAEIVSGDEREHGRRAILNFGHTFGHAIEKLSGYGSWLHGEAVAIGMVMAATLASRIAGFPARDVKRLSDLLEASGLPSAPEPNALDAGAMIDAMGMDKKVLDGNMRFIIPKNLGDIYVDASVPREALDAVLAEFL
mgnify:CR=1 FL=1